MKTRILSASVGIIVALIVLTLNLTYPVLLNIALAIVACIALYEVMVATKYIKNPAIVSVCFAFTAFLQFVPIFGKQMLIQLVVTASVAFFLILFVIMMFMHKKIKIEQLGLVMMTTCMIAFPFFSALYMYWRNAYTDHIIGQSMVIFCFLISWMTDTGAYFTGVCIGKHKLAPEISPKKTVEGAIGGVICCMGIISLIAYLCTARFKVLPFEVNWVNMLIIAGIGSIISMLGDLSFSIIKRSCNIKDFGNIMPGHGGILDRFDSFIFVAPFVCVMNMYLPVIVK